VTYIITVPFGRYVDVQEADHTDGI